MSTPEPTQDQTAARGLQYGFLYGSRFVDGWSLAYDDDDGAFDTKPIGVMTYARFPDTILSAIVGRSARMMIRSKLVNRLYDRGDLVTGAFWDEDAAVTVIKIAGAELRKTGGHRGPPVACRV